jgi:hypothetical protein
MSSGEIIYIVSRLAVMATAAFLAIVLWSRTRDVAWMLVVVGTVAGYTDVLYSTLVKFGVIAENFGSYAGIPFVAILFSNLPYLFFCIAFIVMIVRKKFR